MYASAAACRVNRAVCINTNRKRRLAVLNENQQETLSCLANKQTLVDPSAGKALSQILEVSS